MPRPFLYLVLSHGQLPSPVPTFTRLHCIHYIHCISNECFSSLKSCPFQDWPQDSCRRVSVSLQSTPDCALAYFSNCTPVVPATTMMLSVSVPAWIWHLSWRPKVPTVLASYRSYSLPEHINSMPRERTCMRVEGLGVKQREGGGKEKLERNPGLCFICYPLSLLIGYLSPGPDLKCPTKFTRSSTFPFTL